MESYLVFFDMEKFIALFNCSMLPNSQTIPTRLCFINKQLE